MCIRDSLPEDDLQDQVALIRAGVDALVREGTPMLTVVPEENGSNKHVPAGVGGSLLDELVRDGARQMLAAGLQAEVGAYIEAHADQFDADGHRLVVRNGYHAAREAVSYTHLRAHETVLDLVCRLLLEK